MPNKLSPKVSKTKHQLHRGEDEGLCLARFPHEILQIILFKSQPTPIILGMMVALMNTCTTFATIVLNFMNENMKVVKLPLFHYMFPGKKDTQFNLFYNSYSFFIKFSTEKTTDSNRYNRLLTEPYKLFLNNLIDQHCSIFRKQEYNPLTFALKLLNDEFIFSPFSDGIYEILNKIKLIMECMESPLKPLFSKRNRNKIYCVLTIVNANTVYKLFTLCSNKYYSYRQTDNYKSIMHFIKDYFEKFFKGTTTTYEELSKMKTFNVNFEELFKFIPELTIYAEKYAIKFNVELVTEHLSSSCSQYYLKTNLCKYPIKCQLHIFEFKLNTNQFNYLDKSLQLTKLCDPKTDKKKVLKYASFIVQNEFLSLSNKDDVMIPIWLGFTSPRVQVEEVNFIISNLKYCKLEIQYFIYQRNPIQYERYISKDLKPKIELTSPEKLECIRRLYAYLTPLLTL